MKACLHRMFNFPGSYCNSEAEWKGWCPAEMIRTNSGLMPERERDLTHSYSLHQRAVDIRVKCGPWSVNPIQGWPHLTQRHSGENIRRNEWTLQSATWATEQSVSEKKSVREHGLILRYIRKLWLLWLGLKNNNNSVLPNFYQTEEIIEEQILFLELIILNIIIIKILNIITDPIIARTDNYYQLTFCSYTY